MTNQVDGGDWVGGEIKRLRKEIQLLDEEYGKVYGRVMSWEKRDSDDELETHTRFCHICMKLLSSATVLKTHLKSHAKTKTVTCKLCGGVYNASKLSNLKKHLIEKHDLEKSANKEEVVQNLDWNTDGEDEEDEEDEEIYNFENGDEKDEEDTDDEEEDGSEGEGSEEEMANEAEIEKEQRLGKCITENFEKLIQQRNIATISEKEFLEMKEKLFN